MNVKNFILTHLFYYGCILTVLLAKSLSSSLLVRWLSIPQITGSNPEFSGQKEKILGNVFVLKRAHWAETDFPKIEWFPHRLLTGAAPPPLSEEDPIRVPPSSTSRSSYISPSDTNCPTKANQ